MNEAISKSDIISLVVRLTLLSAATYFSVKWMLNQLDPTNKQKKTAKIKALEQLRRLGVSGVKELTEYEMVIASHLVDPSDIHVTWDDIAGLDDTIQELKETVILPIQRKELFSDSQLTQAPRGVLMHGPPGCGKTLIAKATAREASTKFINLDVSILTDKWYGESQKLASAVFSLAVKLQPCIIFIDEIDSFLRSRNTQDHEATAMMKAQFMALWDGLSTDPDCTVIVMGATNRPHDLDRAILRRMPSTFHIGLPNTTQRKAILNLILDGEPVAPDVDVTKVAEVTDGFSGSDLRELCRNASVYRVRDYTRSTVYHSYNSTKASSGLPSGSSVSGSSPNDESEEFHDALRPITMDDLLLSLKKMKDSRRHCGILPVALD